MTIDPNDHVYVSFETQADIVEMTEDDLIRLGMFVVDLARDERLKRDDPDQWRRRLDTTMRRLQEAVDES